MSITPTTVRLYTTLWEGDVVERVTYQLYNRSITIDKLPALCLRNTKRRGTAFLRYLLPHEFLSKRPPPVYWPGGKTPEWKWADRPYS